MAGRRAKRIAQVSFVILIFSILQIIPLWEPIIQNNSTNLHGTGTTDVEFHTDAPEGLESSDFTFTESSHFDGAKSGFNPSEIYCGYFIENLGQWGGHIRFLAECSFGSVALGNDGVFYNIVNKGEGNVVKVRFHDANVVNPNGRVNLDFTSNFFLGNDPTKWVSEARSYKEVLYEDVWPGIDILYYFKNGNLKYDIIVGEHSDPQMISFFVEGNKGLDIRERELEISISEEARIFDSDLVAYYQNGQSVYIRFKKNSDDTYGFDVKKESGKILIIDPVIFSTSTFLGGSGGDWALDVATDGNNSIIILGGTSSTDFPNTTGAYKTDGGDIVVSKMNQTTSGLIFSTYLGATMGDIPKAFDIDENGDIFVSGLTWSQFFPTTPGVFQETDPSGTFPDVFVLKLNSQGSNLLYSTYVGGTQSDYAYDVKVRDGKAYVVGSTLSYDFPTAGPGVPDAHGTTLFFILNEEGSSLVNSAFWGGWSNEFAYSLDIDNNDDVIIGGVTFSQDFPTTPGAYQTTVSDMNNGFILKYRPSTNSTIFSTYIGGDAGDIVHNVYVDEKFNIYFAGVTLKPSEGAIPYPTTEGAFDRTINGSKDMFITKMDSNGTMLLYSTYIGGDGEEEPGGIDVDLEGNVLLTGFIDSGSNFTVTSDCYDDSHNGEDDGFVLILSSNSSELLYSTYLGGNKSDSGDACMFNETGDIIIVGTTASLNFPVTNGSYQEENKDSSDIFVTVFRKGNYTFLHEGWNLISVPLIQQDTRLRMVLNPIGGSYDTAEFYNAADNFDQWKIVHTSKPIHLNDFKNINHTMGFWVHITEPNGVLFKYDGMMPTQNQHINLYPGWNMVGYPSFSKRLRDNALNNLVYNDEVDSIWTYDSSSGGWEEIAPSDNFETGRGYWIHAKTECVWEVSVGD